MQNSKFKTQNLILGIISILILALIINMPKQESVSAQEIYPMFICSCCGKPLDPDNICCGMAQERITYIDGLTDGKLSKDDVIINYVKKYGLSSFVDKNQAEEFKQKLIREAPANRPIITVSSGSIDMGEISQAKGISETEFEIANTGKSDLIINKIETSCGCTSASIVYQGKEGPIFSMPGHGINEEIDPNWQAVIPAGKTAKLKVYYDPNMHGDLRGAIIREIHIFSNDPIDFEKKVQIELEQVE